MTYEERIEAAAQALCPFSSPCDFHRRDAKEGIAAFLGDTVLYVHDGELRYSDDGSTLTTRECLVHAWEWGMIPLKGAELAS